MDCTTTPSKSLSHLRAVGVIVPIVLWLGGSHSPCQEQPARQLLDAEMERVVGIPENWQAHFLLILASKQSDSKVKKELLYQAERLSSMANQEYLLRFVGPPGMSPAALNAEVRMPRTDRLGLQLRTVKALASVDVQMAKQLIEQISIAPSPGTTCNTALLPDLREDYIDLSELLMLLYTHGPDDIIQRQRIVSKLMSIVSCSCQLAGLVELATTLPTTDAEQALIAASLATSFATLEDGDPAFSVALFDDGLPATFSRLIKHMAARHLSVSALLRAYRQYIKQNMAKRCAYCVMKEKRLLRAAPLNYIHQFNVLLETLRKQGSVSDNDIQTLEGLQPIGRYSDRNDNGHSVYVDTDSMTIRTELETLIDRSESIQHLDPTQVSEWHRDFVSFIGHMEAYAQQIVNNRVTPDDGESIAKVGHLWSLVLEIARTPDDQQRVAQYYAHSIASLWQPGPYETVYYARLRQLVTSCWPITEAETDTSRYSEARMAGIRAGLVGQPDHLKRLARLFAELEATNSTCKQ